MPEVSENDGALLLQGFPALNSADIELNCDSKFALHGKAYQQQGRVYDLQWKPDFQMLHARVRGSGKNRYRQHIDMSGFERFGDIDGECSCPVSFNCKHIAAILFECLQHLYGVDNPATNLAGWQCTMRTLKQDAAVQPKDSQQAEQVIYLLSQSPREGAPLLLNIQRCKRLKSGGWGKPQRVRLENIASVYQRPRYANEADQNIAELIMRLNDGFSYAYDYRDFTISGEEGLIILKRLLLTGRCYWQEPAEKPLRMGTAKTAEFSWRQEEGLHRLDIKLSDIEPGWLSINTDPPYYLDTDSHRLGEIQQSFNSAEFAHLRTLPPLAETELEAFSRFLFHEVNHQDLPSPVELDVSRVEGKPIAHATLMTAFRDGKSSNWLRLQFRYGDCLLQPMHEEQQELALQDPQSVKDEIIIDDRQQEWLIQRQPGEEFALMQTLRQLGMVPMPRSDEKPLTLDWFFMPLSASENASQWHVFLQQQLPELQEQGWLLEHDPGFNLQINQAMDFTGHLSGSGDWFSLGLDIKIGRQKIALLPLVLQWISENTLRQQQDILVEHSPNQWVKISRELVQPIVDTLVELHGGQKLEDNGQLKLPRQHASRLLTLQDELQEIDKSFSFSGGKRIQALAQKLRDFNGIAPVPRPKHLQATLRDYQQAGLNWLGFLADYQFGGILADDMGLGKTLQALAHILSQKELGKLKQPVLVVAPTSLLSNWAREAKRFTPDLRVVINHGPDRFELQDSWAKQDIVITSYALLVRDQAALMQRKWHSLMLDEAQVIKNPKSQAAQVARSINTQNRLCLTGTPMENHLGELWSLFHFLMPDFLGTQARFNVVFRKPIEGDGDVARQQALNQRLQPFMLRRTKSQVAEELPPKTEMIRSVVFDEKQARLYETIRIAMEKKIRKLLKAKGMASSHIEMLDALLKLRQVCCDPRLVNIASAKKVQQSAKLELLMQLVPELLEEGRRILIFSQFTSMLGLIEAELKDRNIGYSKLTGQTRKRDEAIGRFQNGEVEVFLISLKAGGVGLNLTAADTVIHYDPWWNPAAENQATDRAHRIGQDKPVFVYKLITEKTVEEKILALQQRKQALADAVYAGTDATANNKSQGLQAEELLALFEEIA